MDVGRPPQSRRPPPFRYLQAATRPAWRSRSGTLRRKAELASESGDWSASARRRGTRPVRLDITMSDSDDPKSQRPYLDLPEADTWIDYLRTRLPYSFGQIEGQQKQGRRFYVLRDPNPSYHMNPSYYNLWLRGVTSYFAGLLLDRYGVADQWQKEIFMATHGLLDDEQYPGRWTSLTNPKLFHDVLQLDKLFRFAKMNPIDRERVLMTNVMQALEFGLKALQAHASYRECETFRFDSGHNVLVLFEALPTDLQKEIEVESARFGKEYLAYRSGLEKLIEKNGPSLKTDKVRVDWSGVRQFISDYSYTMFLDGTDPSVARGFQQENWLRQALEDCEDIDYFRYSSNSAHDPLPVPSISAGLRMGRFFYEHLFPPPG